MRSRLSIAAIVAVGIGAGCASSASYLRDGRLKEACLASVGERDAERERVAQAVLERSTATLRLALLDRAALTAWLGVAPPEGAGPVLSATIDDATSPVQVAAIVAGVRATGRAYVPPTHWWPAEVASLVGLAVTPLDYDTRGLLDFVSPPQPATKAVLTCVATSPSCGPLLEAAGTLQYKIEREDLACDHGMKRGCAKHVMLPREGRDDPGPDVVRLALVFWDPPCVDGVADLPLAEGSTLAERLAKTFAGAAIPLRSLKVHRVAGATWFDGCTSITNVCRPPSASFTRSPSAR